MKPPLHFHLPEFQKALLQSGIREQLIEWLTWNDPNGFYTDADTSSEAHPLLTIEGARAIMRRQTEESEALRLP